VLAASTMGPPVSSRLEVARVSSPADLLTSRFGDGLAVGPVTGCRAPAAERRHLVADGQCTLANWMASRIGDRMMAARSPTETVSCPVTLFIVVLLWISNQ